jgi:hypothetical protein
MNPLSRNFKKVTSDVPPEDIEDYFLLIDKRFQKQNNLLFNINATLEHLAKAIEETNLILSEKK